MNAGHPQRRTYRRSQPHFSESAIAEVTLLPGERTGPLCC
uniref:Uncharacterized protein n=1 Tax=Arundo donax TaxID=35708 RepID=A0A0A9CAE5_ARUDO